MTNIIKKDLKLLLAQKWIFIIFILFSALSVMTYTGDGKGLYNLIMISVFMATTGIVNPNEKEDILIHSLGVNRYDVVFAKYGLMFILCIVSFLIMALISLIFYGLDTVNDISYLSFGFFRCVLLLTIAMTSVGIPIMIYFGRDSKMGIFICGIMFYFSMTMINSVLIDELNYDVIAKINNPIITIITLVFMIISIILSLEGYKNWQM